MPNDSIHKNLRIYGNVQGVAYRASAQKKAQELGLAGWVRNEPDGTVYAEVEGTADKIQEFIDWCHNGSPWAKVNNVKTADGEIYGYTDFTIRR